MALKRLGVEVDHLFACDVDKHAKATIMANFPPKTWYDDLTTRDNATAPKADVYIAGFPCQPFSMAGLKGGFDDKRGRGNIFFRVRDYIQAAQPKVFVLENVSGLVSIDGGRYFQAICQSLEDLGTYNIMHKILNTQDHGVPQNRKRIYFLGLRKDVDQHTFQWPENLPRRPIGEFLDPAEGPVNARMLPPTSSGTAHANVKTTIKELKAKGHSPFEEDWIVDCDSSPYRFKYVKDTTPCLTCSRSAGHWVTSRGRRMNLNEMLRLQGMITLAEGFKKVVSDRQLGKQIGNAMSCNVLERLFVRVLPSVGLAPPGVLVDRWEAQGLPLGRLSLLMTQPTASQKEPGTPKRSAKAARAGNSSMVTPERRRSKPSQQSDSMATPPTKRRRTSAADLEDDVFMASTGRKPVATPAMKPPAVRRLRALTTEEELQERPMPNVSLEALFEQRRSMLAQDTDIARNPRRGNVEARRISVETVNSSQSPATELLSQSTTLSSQLSRASQPTLLFTQSQSSDDSASQQPSQQPSSQVQDPVEALESQGQRFARAARPSTQQQQQEQEEEEQQQEQSLVVEDHPKTPRTPPAKWACSLDRALVTSAEKAPSKAGRFGQFLRDSRGRFVSAAATNTETAAASTRTG